jgi:hypothetical protein
MILPPDAGQKGSTHWFVCYIDMIICSDGLEWWHGYAMREGCIASRSLFPVENAGYPVRGILLHQKLI